MEFKLAMSPAGGRFFIGILICIFPATLRAQSPSTQLGSLDQARVSLCRLLVPDTIPQSPANANEPMMTNGALPYTPLSSRCKFSIFLSSTDSPYTPSRQSRDSPSLVRAVLYPKCEKTS